MKFLTQDENKLVVAMDVDGAWFYDLMAALELVEGIGALKFGFYQLNSGIESCVELARNTLGEIPIMYDYQRFGSGVTGAGTKFAKILKRAGIDAIVIYPLTGPEMEDVWIKTLMDEGLTVLVGGVMTHPCFLVSEGGYIADDAVLRIYSTAIRQGVRHFLVPGNKPDWAVKVKAFLDRECGDGSYVLFGNGFIRQGGDMSRFLELIGNRLHPIVGSAIYQHKDIEDMRKAAVQISGLLLNNRR